MTWRPDIMCVLDAGIVCCGLSVHRRTQGWLFINNPQNKNPCACSHVITIPDFDTKPYVVNNVASCVYNKSACSMLRFLFIFSKTVRAPAVFAVNASGKDFSRRFVRGLKIDPSSTFLLLHFRHAVAANHVLFQSDSVSEFLSQPLC